MTDLFTASSNADTPIDETKDYFAELVGENAKFKTPQDLARGKLEADRFITQLQNEAKGLRDDLNARTKLEEIMDRIGSPSQTNQLSNEGTPPPREPDGASLTPEAFEALLEKKLTERESAKRTTENFDLVKRTLSQHFGPQYATKLKEQAATAGLSEAFVNDLAATQPQALFKLLDIGIKTATRQDSLFGNAPRSSVAVPNSFTPSGDRTKSFYDGLKQKDSAQYWSPKVQNQMHQDAMRQGEKFFDTNS